MKRKLKIKRETLRNLVDDSLQDAAGGNASTVFTQCGSCLVQCTQTCASCITCAGSICIHTCITCAC